MLYILGSGPYAKEVARHSGVDPEEIEFIVNDRWLGGETLAVGIANPKIKKRVMEEWYFNPERRMKFDLASISPEPERIPKNVAKECVCVNIGPGSIIDPTVKIGSFVAICASVTIGHDAVIGDYCTIAPGVVISGNVTIGSCTFVGAGAIIKDKINIGEDVTVGCGAVVIKDVPDGVTVVGNPARVIKETRRE